MNMSRLSQRVPLKYCIGLIGFYLIALSFSETTRAEEISEPIVSVDQPEHHSPDQSGIQFTNNLLAESIHILGSSRIPITRWNGTVNLAVIGTTDEYIHSKILPVFNEISLLSGIHYQLIAHEFDSADDYAQALATTPQFDLSACDKTSPQICANFVVIISGRKAISNIADTFPLRPVYQRAAKATDDNTLCFFSPGISRSREIVRSLVYVQSDLNESMKLTCLKEEIYQSFGLFGDYTDSQYFSFNNQVKPKSISRYDKWLLTSLYDQSFTAETYAPSVAKQLVEYCRSRCGQYPDNQPELLDSQAVQWDF